MIFRSNLAAPDLSPAFAPRTVCKPRHNSFGHDVLSDPEQPCEPGFMTHDEAAILFNVAREIGGRWFDVGSACGWGAAHLLAAGCDTMLVDPIYKQASLFQRVEENLAWWKKPKWGALSWDSSELWSEMDKGVAFNGATYFDGFVIDGDHTHPNPLNDAKHAAIHLKDRGVIVLHDCYGDPLRGVEWLMDNGFNARLYWTPNVLAVCWRGEFTPPDHIHDPSVEQAWRPHFANFPLARLV